jgi:hypothetical protein
MAIDGIGQGGGAPKVGGSPSSVSGPQTEKFELAADGVEGSAGTELLAQVQRGEVSLDAYLDVRVDDAVSHLEGTLAPEQLEFVKQELREQLESDPVLIELVRRTTGRSPETRES